jgi:hypothetical protein
VREHGEDGVRKRGTNFSEQLLEQTSDAVIVISLMAQSFTGIAAHERSIFEREQI